MNLRFFGDFTFFSKKINLASKRINPKKNLVIGFGITNRTISSLKSANGLVVGSMLCKTITNSLKMGQNPVTKLDKVVYNLKKKII